MAENLLRSDVRNKLVEGNYLHSNRYNFQNMFLGKGGEFTTKRHLEDSPLYGLLEALIKKAQGEEQIFYNEFAEYGVTDAPSFSRRFLSLAYNNENDQKNFKTEEQKVSDIINSTAFVNLLQNKVSKNKVYDNINKEMDIKLDPNGPDELMFRKELDSLLQKQLAQQLQGKIKEGLEQAQARTKLNKSLSIKVEKQVTKKVQEEFFSNNGKYKGTIPKNIINLSKILNSSTDQNTGIRKGFKDIVKRNLKDAEGDLWSLMQRALRYFENELLQVKPEIPIERRKGYIKQLYFVLNKDVKAKVKEQELFLLSSFRNKRVGEVGEVSLAITISWMTQTGQDLEKGLEYSVKRNKQNEKTDTAEKAVSYKSKTDIVATGKSGKKYNIQVKNTLSGLFNTLEEGDIDKYYPMKVNGPIILENLLLQLKKENFITTETQNELLYSIINFEFLSKNGKGIEGNRINKKGKEESNANMSKDGSEQTETLITQLLANGLLYFLGLKSNYGKVIEKKVTRIKSDFEGNLFFILAGKYLVPFSYFLEAIRDGLKNQADALLKIQRPAINITGSVDAEGLYQAKHTLAIEEGEKERLINPKQRANLYNYPSSIYGLGKTAGDTLVNGATIKTGIHVLINIAKLKQKFNERVQNGF